MAHPCPAARDPFKGAALAGRQSRTGGALKVRPGIGLLRTPMVAKALFAGFP